MTVTDKEGIKPIDLARDNGFEDCVHELYRAAKTGVMVRDELQEQTHIVSFIFSLSIVVLK